jgi:4-carboxymuconolactone decarboxylase
MTNNDNQRFERGVENINKLVKDGDKRVLKGVGDVAPDLAQYVLEFIFGDLYNRDGLDLKTKQIVTITALAVLGNARPQLEYHIKCGLNLGLTRQEIIDVITHISGYAGFPAALNGITAAKEVFASIDQPGG